MHFQVFHTDLYSHIKRGKNAFLRTLFASSRVRRTMQKPKSIAQHLFAFIHFASFLSCAILTAKS